MEKKVVGGQLIVGRWFYSRPSMRVDKRGNYTTVAIKMLSFGPAEVYEWGITPEKTFYEKYEWCENDFFADDNYEKEISKEEFIAQIEKMKALVHDTEVEEWESVYDEMLKSL